VLVARFFRKDRAVMFELTGRLELVATTNDGPVLACLQHAREHWAQRRDFIPLPPVAEGGEDGPGIAFASANWRAAITDRRHPGMVARRHFEAMVFTYLAGELRTGDIAVTGAGEYADWRANLPSSTARTSPGQPTSPARTSTARTSPARGGAKLRPFRRAGN